MNEYTTESCYNWFHIETNLVKGVQVSSITNFTKAKANVASWQSFTTFALKCSRSGGLINPRLFIKALAKHYDGWFEPDLLNRFKSVQIYKSYQREQVVKVGKSDVLNGVRSSAKNIAKYCATNNITFTEYLDEGVVMFPRLYADYCAGTIDIHFLAMLPNFEALVYKYPCDTQLEFFNAVPIDQFDKARMRVLHYEDCGKDIKIMLKVPIRFMDVLIQNEIKKMQTNV